jgi:peptidyl-prolyl cis-trans isomerase C
MTRIVPLLVALALAACSKSTPAAANTESPTPGTSQQGQPVPAVLPDVLARVNGETITKVEFERALKELEGRAGEPVPSEERDRIYRGVLDQIIAYRLLLQESQVRRVAVADAEVDGRIEEIRKQFPSEEAFTQTLEQRSITLAALRDDARRGMQIDKMVQAEVRDKVAVSPAQVTEFYQKNPSQFHQGERVRASHILIRTPQNADAAAKEQARTRAADLLKDVKAGKDFAALAKEHSQDPGSAVGGGDLGFFERGQMVGPFEEAAFGLQAAQVSDLVETQFGYHIIKVVERQPSRTVALEEVRPQIQQFLEGQNREQQTQAFVEALKAKGKVEIYI